MESATGTTGAAAPRHAGSGEQPHVRIPINRMLIALLALAGLLIATYMLLFKLGLIGELACGLGACDRVQASPWAVFLGLPVPLWGVVGYAFILALALVGVQPGFARDRRVGLGLLLATGYAFGFSMYLTYLEAFVINAWCQWCVVSAFIATALFACALPELRRARRTGGT
jgi:uncharacterized membrane protein